MGPIMMGVVGILVLLVVLFLGMQIGIAMTLVGFVGYYLVSGSMKAALGVLQTVPFTTAGNFNLSVIPMFILMGQVCYESSVSTELYDACFHLLSRAKGGLACATVVACAGFAAICGSATATTATMGIVSLPEMERYKYKPALSTGSISAGGTLGILIPPSTGFILYGTTATIGIGKLFAAGMLPGLVLAFCYCMVVIIWCTIDPTAGPKGPHFKGREILRSLVGIVPVVILFVIVLGGIYAGLFAPAQGGAIGAFGAIVIMICKRRFTWKHMINALRDTIRTTAMIFMIMIGAYVFGYFLTLTGCPAALATWAVSLPVSRYVVLFFILLIYAVLGMFVDSMPLIVLLVPIFLPIITQLEFDTLWFGVLMVMMMELGLLTPPVGMCCYVMAGVAKNIPLSTIFKGSFYFIIGLLVAVVIVVAFPQLSTWLPSVIVS